MREANEERRRYCQEQFDGLPPDLRREIEKYLSDKTFARRGDSDFELWVANIMFEFGVRNTKKPADQPAPGVVPNVDPYRGYESCSDEWDV